MNTKLYVSLAIVALAAVFIVQNMEVVEIRFLFWKIGMSRSLMFIFLTLAGVVVGWLLRGYMSHKRSGQSSDLTT